jgi:hypothetical protein
MIQLEIGNSGLIHLIFRGSQRVYEALKPDRRLGIVPMCREGHENTRFIEAH